MYFFFIQYTGIEYWAVPVLQIILWHQQITKNLKVFPLVLQHTQLTASLTTVTLINELSAAQSFVKNSFPATQQNTNLPTMQAIIKYLRVSHNFYSACTVPKLWIQGTERTLTIVLPSVVFTRHWLTDRRAGQNDMCTVLPLVLQQRTNETCTDLVQWNCCYPNKHKCSLYKFLCLLRGTPRQIYRGA